MVKYTQTIRWQQQTNYLSVFDHFMKLALKWLIAWEIFGFNIVNLQTNL